MSETDTDAVERLAHALNKMAFDAVGTKRHDVVPDLEKSRDTLRALLAAKEAAEDRAYTLAVAIMGGEDAPGHADSIDAKTLADQLRKERADQDAWVDACVKAGREAAEAEAAALRDKVAQTAAALIIWQEAHKTREGVQLDLAFAHSHATLATLDQPKEGEDNDE